MSKKTARAELVGRVGAEEADRLTQMFLDDLMTIRVAAGELNLSRRVIQYRLVCGDTRHARNMAEPDKPHAQPRWVLVREPMPGRPQTLEDALTDLIGREEADRLINSFLAGLLLADEAATIVGMSAKTLRADMYKGVVPYCKKLDPVARKSPWVVLPDALPALKQRAQTVQKKREGRSA